MIKEFDLQEAAAKYQSAQPFPHIILHNLIDVDILNAVHDEFPDIASLPDQNYPNNGLERKNYTSGRKYFGPVTNQLVDYFNSEEWVSKLQVLTGIQEKLVSDEELVGGGLSESGRGALLKCHADFNLHIKNGLDRRVNMLIYLNKGWKAEWNGAIELWNRDMTECMSKAYPVFNTIVIFNTDDYSYHGFPDEILCPEGEKRKGLNMYYFSNGRPEHEKNPELHMSIWKARVGFEADAEVDKLARL